MCSRITQWDDICQRVVVTGGYWAVTGGCVARLLTAPSGRVPVLDAVWPLLAMKRVRLWTRGPTIRAVCPMKAFMGYFPPLTARIYAGANYAAVVALPSAPAVSIQRSELDAVLVLPGSAPHGPGGNAAASSALVGPAAWLAGVAGTVRRFGAWWGGESQSTAAASGYGSHQGEDGEWHGGGEEEEECDESGGESALEVAARLVTRSSPVVLTRGVVAVVHCCAEGLLAHDDTFAEALELTMGAATPRGMARGTAYTLPSATFYKWLRRQAPILDADEGLLRIVVRVLAFMGLCLPVLDVPSTSSAQSSENKESSENEGGTDGDAGKHSNQHDQERRKGTSASESDNECGRVAYDGAMHEDRARQRQPLKVIGFRVRRFDSCVITVEGAIAEATAQPLTLASLDVMRCRVMDAIVTEYERLGHIAHDLEAVERDLAALVQSSDSYTGQRNAQGRRAIAPLAASRAKRLLACRRALGERRVKCEGRCAPFETLLWRFDTVADAAEVATALELRKEANSALLSVADAMVHPVEAGAGGGPGDENGSGTGQGRYPRVDHVEHLSAAVRDGSITLGAQLGEVSQRTTSADIAAADVADAFDGVLDGRALEDELDALFGPAPSSTVAQGHGMGMRHTDMTTLKRAPFGQRYGGQPSV